VLKIIYSMKKCVSILPHKDDSFRNHGGKDWN